jgi:hypothetical protein
MKKNSALLMVLFAVQMHAMEKENTWSVTAYGTKINLNKVDILDYYADDTKKEEVVICVGQHKQQELGAVPGYASLGYCYVQHIVRFKPKIGSPHYQKACSNKWKLRARKGACFLCVTEPYFSKHMFYAYCDSDHNIYTGELAIQKSCEDLVLCYNAALDCGVPLLKEKKSKNIALPMLGADAQRDYWGIPKDKAAPVAVDAILTYIKNKPNFYDSIQLFMEEDIDFNLYKKLLIQWINTEKNVLLFYFAHKDPEHLLSLLPRELIKYITELI